MDRPAARPSLGGDWAAAELGQGCPGTLSLTEPAGFAAQTTAFLATTRTAHPTVPQTSAPAPSSNIPSVLTSSYRMVAC